MKAMAGEMWFAMLLSLASEDEELEDDDGGAIVGRIVGGEASRSNN